MDRAAIDRRPLLAAWTGDLVGLGGWGGLTNGWPLWRDDHPLYYHSALVTRSFLRSSWTTAGYDPSFMAGYAKSVVFPSSSTLPEVVIAAFGGGRPGACLQALRARLGRGRSLADRPRLRALEGSPRGNRRRRLALICSTSGPTSRSITWRSGCCRIFWRSRWACSRPRASVAFLECGGSINWFCARSLSLAWSLVHLTTAMVVVPAVLRRDTGRHGGRSRRTSRVVRGPGWRHLGGLDDSAIVAGGQCVLVAARGSGWLDQGTERLRLCPPRRGRAALADRQPRREPPIQSVVLAPGLRGSLSWSIQVE